MCSMKHSQLLASDMLSIYNVYRLKGVIQLGKLRLQHPDIKDCMSAHDIFHTYVVFYFIAIFFVSSLFPNNIGGCKKLLAMFCHV